MKLKSFLKSIWKHIWPTVKQKKPTETIFDIMKERRRLDVEFENKISKAKHKFDAKVKEILDSQMDPNVTPEDFSLIKSYIFHQRLANNILKYYGSDEFGETSEQSVILKKMDEIYEHK